MGKREIKFEDNRKKEIIFLSSCILNQNNRFPGIAVHKGAINNLIEPFLKEGIGIEQLPCLECMGWGGVSRKNIFRFLPSIFRHSNSKLMKLSSKIWTSIAAIFKDSTMCSLFKAKFAAAIKIAIFLPSFFKRRHNSP